MTINVTRIETFGKNISCAKAARQSGSPVFSKHNEAAGALSGRRTGQSNFRIEDANKPWWEVDLGDEFPISEILIFNRLDECADRANNLCLLGGKASGRWDWLHEAGRPFGSVAGYPLRVPVKDALFRFIRLELTGPGHLRLDQVEIYTHLFFGRIPERSADTQRAISYATS